MWALPVHAAVQRARARARLIRARARAVHPYGARIQLHAPIYIDIASKRVKHSRKAKGGHCQGINFVTRNPPKACKTQ